MPVTKAARQAGHSQKNGGTPDMDMSGADTVNRIIEATYRCLAAHGPAKMTMETIAKAASVSRGTVYNHFASRENLLEYVRCLEVQKVNREIRAKLDKSLDIVGLITEAMLLGTRVCQENVYVRTMIHSLSHVSQGAQAGSIGHRQVRDLWRNLLSSALAEGKLARDQNMDDMVTWLLLSHYMLLTKVEAADSPDEELRAFIRRYVVTPMVREGA